MSSEWSSPERVADYLKREIPHRDVAEGLLLAALPDPVERVIDLGTGDGRLLALIAGEHPDVRGVGVDNSEEMLTRARARARARDAREQEGDQRLEVRFGDLAQPLDIPGADAVDAVVSGLAVHHLEDERKRALFAAVFALLRPGGVFANLDLVAPPSERAHVRFRELIGRVEDDPTDRLADLGDQLHWLRETGFEEVDCPFKWLELALMVGRRPA